MKSWKWLALMASGCTLMAIGGCGSIIRELAIQAIITQVMETLISVFTTPLRAALEAAAGGAA